MTQSYDVNAVHTDPAFSYDLISGSYSFNGFLGDNGSVKYIEPLPAREWSPDALASSGIR
jgi:hypothetical protein